MPANLLGSPNTASPGSYGIALAACLLTTLIATPLSGHLELSNIVMLFLLTVLLVALRLGRGPAVLAAFLSVAFFDFFFVPPKFSFTVNDAQYIITFAVMLVVALVTGYLGAGLRRQAEIASLNEKQTHALYEMARDLAGALVLDQVSGIVRKLIIPGLDLDVALMLPDEQGNLQVFPALSNTMRVEPRYALMAFDRGEPVDDFTLSGHGHGASYFPLKAPMKVRGVIVFAPTGDNHFLLHEHQRLLATIASLAAIAIERLHYVEVAQSTQLQIVSERLRSSILSALSHDLRTPLTALVGLADSLTLTKPPLPDGARETAEAIRDQALRLSGLVVNLLDMARLHAGRITLRKEWQPVEEVIGASIKLLGRGLADHTVQVSLAKDMPLLEFDAVLIERVFGNLLENAAKWAPPDSSIEIIGHPAGPLVEISVCDKGPGFPAEKGDTVFEMFVRGQPESPASGVGLGLAICRAIIEAHNGTIRATNRPEGGACVTFTLPAGTPPVIEEEPEGLGENPS